MKTLKEIKNEVTKEFQGYDSWEWMAKNDPVCLEDQEMVDEVATRYALEAIKADRENIKNQIKVRQCIYTSKGFYHPAENLIDIIPIGLP